MGKTTVKDCERGNSYKSRRILHAYCYTAKLKFTLRFKQLNLEITMHKQCINLMSRFVLRPKALALDQDRTMNINLYS